jgi:two-component system cell cycle sensor histidine kinase/response regulator CckA
VQAAAVSDRKRLERWVSECLANQGRHSIEFQITRPNGDVRIVSCTSEVSVDEQGSPTRLFGACQDITDSRRAQQEDLARHKLESVGTLAGGIAHDFNNLLGGVLAHAELALAGSASEYYPNEELTAIRNVAIRGSEIVRQLLTYAGKDSEVLGFVDVSWIVGEMLELLKVSVSKRATLVTDLCRDLPSVRASATQIRQIVMNLVTNASEAIADNDGVIRVATACVIQPRDATAAKGPADGCYVQLEVSDTGSGMSQEMLAKVFDPFYSSKGAGHGLGLAVVHGIVRTLGGSIHVSSEPGQGSIFRVVLPSAGTTVEATRDPIADREEAACPSRQSVVLVVEDEDPLRQAVGKMLQKAGFAVLEAADGDTALDLLCANVGEIDLILLDMTIPGASSHEVLAEAVKARPGIRVILTSAYSQEMLTPRISGPQIDGFIRKPYRLADLVQILRKASSS